METCIKWKLIKNDLFDKLFIWYELDIDENVFNQLLNDKIIHLFSKNLLYLKYIRSNYGISSENIDKYIEKYKSDKLKKVILLKPYLFSKYPGYLKAAKLLYSSSVTYEVGKEFTSGMITHKKDDLIISMSSELPALGYDLTNMARIILYIWKNT
jgi:hypothetical protein